MEKQIENWNNYTINENGEVRNIKTKRILKQHKTNKGYLWVELYNNKEHKKFSIHRLVAQAFILNPENKPQVNHKDGNKENNNVNNLEWVTNQENRNHAIKNNLTKNLCGEEAPWSKLTKEKVIYIRKLYDDKTVLFNAKELAKKFNVSTTQIRMVANRKSWKNI